MFDKEFCSRLIAHSVEFIEGDIQTCDFTTDADIILLQEVIEHVRKPKRVLEKIFTGMKQGSILYLTTNNIFYYGYLIKLLFLRQIYDSIESEDTDYPGHCRYYSINELIDFFAHRGGDFFVRLR